MGRMGDQPENARAKDSCERPDYDREQVATYFFSLLRHERGARILANRLRAPK